MPTTVMPFTEFGQLFAAFFLKCGRPYRTYSSKGSVAPHCGSLAPALEFMTSCFVVIDRPERSMQTPNLLPVKTCGFVRVACALSLSLLFAEAPLNSQES